MLTIISNFIKNNKYAYSIYFYGGSLILRFFSLFIKPDKDSFLFISNGGEKYDDSPKHIFENLLIKAPHLKYYWVFVNPEKFNVPKAIKIKMGTFAYFVTALKCKTWITNSSVERGLKFKSKNILCFNTWHGTPIKKIGLDIEKAKGLGSKNNFTGDVLLAQGKYDVDIFSNAFLINKDNIKCFGFPRNDNLVNKSNFNKSEVLNEIGIYSDKKIILYAPTHREFLLDKQFNNLLSPPLNFSNWKKILGNDYLVLFRAHSMTSKVLGIDFDENKNFLYDVSNYHTLNDLMLVSDILISDYSSIFFDYSLLKKPMFCFGYDFEDYVDKRGLYINIKKELPNGVITNENQLLSEIKNIDEELQRENSIKFQKKYVQFYGSATENSVDYILENTKEMKK